MSLAITPEQRDALYDQILDRLSGIGDIELAVQLEDFVAAERIGREYSDELRLLLDDLGFGESNGKPVTLTSPHEVLRRVLPRMRELAEAYTASREPEWAEARELKDRTRLVAEACRSVIATLDGEA